MVRGSANLLSHLLPRSACGVSSCYSQNSIEQTAHCDHKPRAAWLFFAPLACVFASACVLCVWVWVGVGERVFVGLCGYLLIDMDSFYYGYGGQSNSEWPLLKILVGFHI